MRRDEHAGRLALSCILWAAVGFGFGCQSESPSESPREEQEEHQETEQDVGVDTGDEMAKKRSAYGLPFPPKVRGVTEGNDVVEVTTRIELPELEEFYESRLVDYEILRPGDRALRVVGLRKYMPTIHGRRYGPLSILQYFPGRQKPEIPESEETEKSKEDVGSTTYVYGQEEDTDGWRQPGSPVRLKTSDGELLAPGAKWGEPYTPPDGSPLDKPRYQANFGKPLGEWQLP